MKNLWKRSKTMITENEYNHIYEHYRRKQNAFIIFLVFTFSWWFLSILLGFHYNIDLNPLLSNKGEIICNTVVFLLGFVFLYDKVGNEYLKP